MNTMSTFVEPVIHIDNPSSIWNHLDSSEMLQFFWIGRQPYLPIWKLQKELHSKRVLGEINNIVLFVEHEHVYTLGKNADMNFLLDSKSHDAEVIQIDRGGQVTYHGPGQLVCYPIIDLHNYKMSVSWYMRSLEEVIMNCLNKLGIESSRKEDLTGVWIEDEKICAMGVRLSKWVTMHGFAMNLNPDLKYYDGIIPCGIFDHGITSLQEQGVYVSIESLMENLINSFKMVFKK